MRLAIGVSFWLIASAAMPTAPARAQVQPPAPAAVPVHAPSDALDLGPMTIAGDLTYFSGQLVRLSAVRVYDVLSPRVFSIEPIGVPSSQMWRHDYRSLVVLATPLPESSLRCGAIVEIVGRPWTFDEAQLQRDQTGLSDLRPKVARRYVLKPVIRASLVRMPGGMELYTTR